MEEPYCFWRKSDFQNGRWRPFWKFKKKKVVYWSEMARNAFESDFRLSKMAAGSHFVKKKRNTSCVLIWIGEKCDQKWFAVIQNGRREPFCWKKNQSCILIWNGEKCDQKWFSVIQNGRWQPFCENKSFVLIWNGEKCDQKWLYLRSSKMAAGNVIYSVCSYKQNLRAYQPKIIVVEQNSLSKGKHT